ncbi:class I SAM-dependent methyltransferase [Nonomuraea sp. NPDC048826]|uniref:class I SAM-dependent methyltransferase n=1 Tax=Nonomuraea sp. NPDC048826 TaxID=3364347 RepID=UPI003721A40D
MSEASETSTTTSVETVIRITTQTYSQKAQEYAMTTGDYASFPGLEAEVLSFADMTPARLPLLDLGCGAGRDAHRIAALGRKVIAGDISVSMLRCARRHAEADNTPSVPYTAFDALRLPFRAGAVGGVWASGSLLHLPSSVIPQALSEILRVLAPGGVAAISMQAGTGEGWRDGGTLNGRRWFTFVQPEHFSSAMSCLGFDDVRVLRTGRRNWFIAWGSSA